MPRGRVLLLEDDLALRSLLHEALAGEGLDVRACDSFEEIRDAAAERAGDLVIADFWGGSQRVLPDHERQEIHELCSFLPVVLLTGRTWAAEMNAQELGARALIRKPFDLEHLLEIVEEALSNGQP
ncbi:MAG: response regulator [Chloroflexi bacterium]|nr:response regulator [Chloroflexota bacterium]